MSESTRPARSWKCEPTCPVCGAPNPPMRRTCSIECKRIAKRAYDKARYPDVQTKKVESAVRWQVENRERKQTYDAAYREATREKRLALKREYERRMWETQPEKMRARARNSVHARRARTLGGGSFVVLERDRRRALHRARYRCAECESRFTPENPLEWDHVVPVIRGGRHSIGNLAPLCRNCNRNKARRFRVEWRAGKVMDGRRPWGKRAAQTV